MLPWLRPSPPPATRIEALDAGAAPRLAELHAASFAGPWEEHDFERLLADRLVHAHGLYLEPGQGRLPYPGFFGATLPGTAFLRGFLDGLSRNSRDPIGFALSRAVADEAEILTLALDPGMRGRGLSAPLLRHHLGALARAGVRRVHLEVEEGNAPALALYRRHGFEQVGQRPGYYRQPDAPATGALVLTATL